MALNARYEKTRSGEALDKLILWVLAAATCCIQHPPWCPGGHKGYRQLGMKAKNYIAMHAFIVRGNNTV